MNSFFERKPIRLFLTPYIRSSESDNDDLPSDSTYQLGLIKNDWSITKLKWRTLLCILHQDLETWWW